MGVGKQFESFNPATGLNVWQGNETTEDDLDRAISSAHHAFSMWAHLPFEERIAYIRSFQSVLTSHQDSFAKTISKEMGKPFWESQQEVSAMLAKCDVSIQAFQERCSPVTHNLTHSELKIRYKPHGVVAVLGPFNFPGHLPNGHIIPALLAGNTILFKPSALTPLCGQHLLNLWREAGLPSGVIELVQGGKQLGQLIASKQSIDALFFTGSSHAGKSLSRLFAETPGRLLALEMGGNNPIVIGSLSDPKMAAYHTVVSSFITSGQRCSCSRRLILPRYLNHERFLDYLQSMTESLKIGPYDDVDEPFMGPLVTSESAHSLYSYYRAFVDNGGVPLVPMSLLSPSSAFLSPGIVDMTDVPDRQDVELFGPLLQVIYVESFEDAIKEANATSYGLTASLFSDDPHEYDLFYTQIRAGVINHNMPTTGASGLGPFGGIGDSGNFRPSAYFASDYCSYPTASLIQTDSDEPPKLFPGLPYD